MNWGNMTRRKPVTEIGNEGWNAPDRWHVNRGVPIVWIVGSLFIGLAQFGGFVWYASQFNTRVEIIEKAQALSAPQGERLTRLEEKVVAVQATAGTGLFRPSVA